jgi:hypothetical protein
MKVIRALALVSMTWCCSLRPLVPITATVQLDAWASKPIYLSMGVLLSDLRTYLAGKRDRGPDQRRTPLSFQEGNVSSGWYVG